ncbi:MAG: hydrolase [Parachlamydiaceae bacterium]
MNNLIPYLEQIDEEYPQVIQMIEQWCSINSWSQNITGLKKMIEQLTQAFAPLLGDCCKVSLPPWQRFNQEGVLESIPLGDALSITKRRQANKKILLCGHMDTVFPQSSPFSSCRKDGKEKLIGPGVADMKGGLGILLLALKIFEKSPYADLISWEVFINPDEEIGSISSKNILEAKAAHYNLGLLFEPALPDGSIAGERKGSANYTLLAKGRAAHVGRDFHLGKNAIVALAKFAKKIEQLQGCFEGLTINVGYIHGGGAINIIPDHAFGRMNVRFSERRNLSYVEQKLQVFKEEILRESGAIIDIYEESLRWPKLLDEKTKMIYQQFKECANYLNETLVLSSTGGVCDGNTLANAGLPNLDTLGAVGGNIHTTEEFILVDSIRQRAKLLFLFLVNFAQAGCNHVTSQ